MITKKPSSEPRYVTRDGPRIKTVCLQVAVTESSLQDSVWEAFALAKSAGRELDLAFTSQSPMTSTATPSSHEGAYLAPPRLEC